VADVRSPFSAVQAVRQGSGVMHATSATAQAVRQGLGGSLRSTFVTVQAVLQTTPREVRTSFVAVQAVLRVLTQQMRAAQVVAQVIRQGDDGAMARVPFSVTQLVWTTGDPSGVRQRAWTFDFDGHTFYVLDLGSNGTLVYDILTQQWSRFRTAGYGGWNFKNGFHWRSGKMVIGGADGSGQLLKLTPQSFLDEGWRPVIYEVTGILQTGGIDFLRQYALRMVGSAGVLADSISPTLFMEFSDDRGVTWGPTYQIELTTNTRQRIEFRSLGAFTAPGRMFRIYDEGGIKFIANVEADIGGADGRTPS